MMSLTIVSLTMEGGDHITGPKATAEWKGPKVPVPMGAGDHLEKGLVGLEADQERVEKRGRKKEKRERRRKASGWRSRLLSCFGCGADNEDHDQHLEKEQVMTQKERLREEARKAREASVEKFRKLAEDDLRRKQSYECIQRGRRLVEANKEWDALPLKPEDAEKKVAFNEVHRCDIWHFEEEPVPTHICHLWTKIQEELRQSAEQEEQEREKERRRREERQSALWRQKAKAPANQSNPYKAVMVILFLLAYLVYQWLCSQTRRVFKRIRYLK